LKDYSSISPSAKGLLYLKGFTDIPFMADVAKIVWGNAVLSSLKGSSKDPNFFRGMIHFEARYKSVDNLLNSLGGENIIEISSGFSFRGLNMVLVNPDVTYIDTDLPNVIDTKNDIVNELISRQSIDPQGELLIVPLNVLDETAFANIVSKLPDGPVTIVNEGLLVYLNDEEKATLCRIIHSILVKRGGHWITGDIYIKKDGTSLLADGPAKEFLKAHNVEENKFDSFEQAEAFFNKCGFTIHKKADSVAQQLSTLKYLPPQALEKLMGESTRFGKVRETWALKAF